MFSIGDKVLYPMYGAGVIEDLEEKNIDGQVHVYYVLNIPIGNLKILASVKNAESAGIRCVLSADEINKSIVSIKDMPISMSDNWNQRYKDNMGKLKSGNMHEAAEVFRNLKLRERERGLSSAEKKVLSTAKQIILSEIVLAYDVEKGAAEEILEDAVL